MSIDINLNNLTNLPNEELYKAVEALAACIDDQALNFKVEQFCLKSFKPKWTPEPHERSLDVLEGLRKIIQVVVDKGVYKNLKRALGRIDYLNKDILSERSGKISAALLPKSNEVLIDPIITISKGKPVREFFLNEPAKQAVFSLINNTGHNLIEYLDFRGFKDFDNECLELVTTNFPHLKHLFLEECQIKGDALKYLKNTPLLQSLHIARYRELEADALKNLEQVSKLLSLNIEGCPHFTALENLQHTPDLQSLNFEAENDALKNLQYTPKLQNLSIGRSKNLEADALKHLALVPGLQSLSVAGNLALAADALKYLEHTPYLKNLNISKCINFNTLVYLKYTPDLLSLNISGCGALEKDALKNLEIIPKLRDLKFADCAQFEADSLKHLIHVTKLQSLDFTRRQFETGSYLEPLYLLEDLTNGWSFMDSRKDESIPISAYDPAKLAEEVTLSRDLFPLEGMSNWKNFVVRDKNWDNLEMYKLNGTQEPYGRKMEQAIKVVTDLIKNNAPFQKVFEYAATLRYLIAQDFDHEGKENFGVYRTDNGRGPVTPLVSIYEELGSYLEKKLEEDINNPRFRDSSLNRWRIFGYIKGRKIDLSYLDLSKKSLIHTSGSEISAVMAHVIDLYHLAIQEQDPRKVQEIAGALFWWFCQAKPVKRGDPSIAEIIIRAIFASKDMPNLPWNVGMVPWVEVTKELNPRTFSENFPNLFEPPKKDLIETLMDCMKSKRPRI